MSDATSAGAGRRKVLAVASGGGHWVQLCRLVPALAQDDVVFASTDPDVPADLRGAVYYRITDATRRDRVAFAPLTVELGRILMRERPEVVITTGAAPGLVALALAKTLLRSRTVWIDSIANVERLSTAGMLARRVSDVWLTQWEHLSAPGGPDYWGSVL